MPVFFLPSIEADEALRLTESGEAVLVDLRKPPAVSDSGQLVLGALRRDPSRSPMTTR